MNGMLRELLSERADAAGSHDLDLLDLIAHGERRVTRRRRVALAGTAAAVALSVGASLALVQAGDGTSPPVSPPTDPPSNADVLPDTADPSRPLTYGVNATIYYGDRIIEAAEDPDGLYVFDDGLWFFTGENEGTSTTHLYYTDGSSEPVEIARGIDRVTPGEVGSLLVWQDGDDVVIYDTNVRDVVARVPLNGQRLGNPIIPLEDTVHWREYDDTADSISDGRSVRYDVSTGTRTRVSRADERAAGARAAGPPHLVVGSADSRNPAEDFTVIDSRLEFDTDAQGARPPVFVAATGERLRVTVPDGYEGESLGVRQWLDDDRFALVVHGTGGIGRVPTGDLLVCRISSGECRTVASGEQDWLLPGAFGGVGAEG
ncbi:hypothetical protein [Nocardioides sp.]|uniref:hypothetical protein n=1 Tax=Nocardioides sp. TaxID=35761 RepID=UPI002ED602D0